MHTVELYEQACDAARRAGYEIRQEWLGGSGGGACEFGGKRWIFVDLALTAVEQLDQVTEALAADQTVIAGELPPLVQNLLKRRPAA